MGAAAGGFAGSKFGKGSGQLAMTAGGVLLGALLGSQVGKSLDVLIDSPDPETPGWWIGRSFADAPDIDPTVKVKSKKVAAGEIVPVKITAAEGYDLLGKV